MSEGIAFSSSAPEVLEAWEKWKAHREDVRVRRDAMIERFGRGLMVNRSGFGHGTRVVGFERLDGDKGGDVVGEHGELRVPVKNYEPTVVPNIRRKAGKDLRTELDTLNEDAPELPGMPGWHLVGLTVLAPALMEHEGVLWARWADDVTEVVTGGKTDSTLWTTRPLSEYFAAVEAKEAACPGQG